MATTYGHNDTAPESLGSFISNSRQIVIALVVLLCAVAGYSVYASRNSAKADAGRNALYLAEKSRETETKALSPATQAPAATTPGKAASPPATPPAAPEVAYKKLDVDGAFPETLKKLRAVTSDYSGTRSAFDSQMAIGELYFNHGAPDKALAAYQGAIDRAPSPFEKALALSSVGYARENAGQLKEALDAFDKALNIGDPGLKGDLWMGKARVFTALKDPAQAKSTYDQIISQLPNTNYAKYAEIYKSRLE